MIACSTGAQGMDSAQLERLWLPCWKGACTRLAPRKEAGVGLWYVHVSTAAAMRLRLQLRQGDAGGAAQQRVPRQLREYPSRSSTLLL